MADDSNNIEFETIILELQRVKDLQQKQEEIEEKLSETTEEVEDVKVSTEDVEKVIGIKESNKKKNVIDGDKLSSTLTTSEKKRYENIGKVFIEGAGKEMENVRKSVQFKDAMSTVRKKFTDGVIQFKEGLKKAQKVGSFFGKLMIIIGLLGTIVFLFKDKILSFFPNIGEKITNFFETAKMSIPHILGGLLSYVTTSIGSSFQNILREVVNEIPGLIGEFFGVTLPNAIVTLYVGILSSFSVSASKIYNDRLGTMLGEPIHTDAEKLAKEAETELQQNTLVASYQKITERVNQGELDSTYSDMREAQQGASVLAMMQNNTSAQVLNYLDSLTHGNTDIGQLIQSGQFNAATFLQSIREANSDNKITNQEVLQAINNSISQELRNTGNFNLSQAVNGDDVSEFSNALLEMNARATAQRESFSTMMRQKMQNEQQQNNRENVYRNITNINAVDVISDTLAETFKKLTETIITFLSGNTIADTLKKSFQNLNNKFSQFFGKFNGFVDEAFKTVGVSVSQLAEFCIGVERTLQNNNPINVDEISDKHFVPHFNFNAIVNVQIPQNDSSEAISNLISDVVSIDETLANTMSASNDIMLDVIKNFSNIHDLHTCSKEYIDNTIRNNCDVLSNIIKGNTASICDNKRSIDKINLSLRQSPNSPIRQSYIAPCLDLS